VILLVEDDEDVREMLAFTLRSRGYAVEVVTNGSGALEALERERPCLMILDLVMPVMNGWAVLAQMKARQMSDVPVCVISALEGQRPVEAVATLGKPFDTTELFALAERYCAHGRRSAAPVG
jgi:DNA-binding response OmpR family regulator